MSDRNETARYIAEKLHMGAAAAVNRLVDLYMSKVPAELFNPHGKWKYSVKLDYRNQPDGYINPHDNATRAFEQASANGTSEVTMSTIPAGWTLFVPEPPEGWPLMVRGGAQ